MVRMTKKIKIIQCHPSPGPGRPAINRARNVASVGWHPAALCAPAPPAGRDALRGRPDACSAGECCAAHRLLPATAYVYPANYCQMAVSQ